MRIIETVSEMQQLAHTWHQNQHRIALVPTMGYLHEGHLALMRKGVELSDVAVVSIFVNPTQFGPGEDFERYPRNSERDLRLAQDLGMDAVFMPPSETMYPTGYQTYVEVTEVTLPLCGQSRPGHFRGVTTVVAKLFHIVQPDVAVFGEKDFQQLVTIRRMVQDLNMNVAVVGHPIVREADGLAMSSRNAYLSDRQRQSALGLNRSLKQAQELVNSGESRGEVIVQKVRNTLQRCEDLRLDYVELRQPDTLEAVERLQGPTLLALAAYVGNTRLIDNCILTLAV